MKKIELHFREADGTKGVINYFSDDNVGLSAGTPDQRASAFAKLKAKALEFQSKWTAIYPDTQFRVVEV
jgi:hypothetical protein